MKFSQPTWFDELDAERGSAEPLTYDCELEVVCANGKTFQENFKDWEFRAYRPATNSVLFEEGSLNFIDIFTHDKVQTKGNFDSNTSWIQFHGNRVLFVRYFTSSISPEILSDELGLILSSIMGSKNIELKKWTIRSYITDYGDERITRKGTSKKDFGAYYESLKKRYH